MQYAYELHILHLNSLSNEYTLIIVINPFVQPECVCVKYEPTFIK